MRLTPWSEDSTVGRAFHIRGRYHRPGKGLMAVRKSTMIDQVAESIATINPADRPMTTFHCVSAFPVNLLGRAPVSA
jgi:hypothetical protein